MLQKSQILTEHPAPFQHLEGRKNICDNLLLSKLTERCKIGASDTIEVMCRCGSNTDPSIPSQKTDHRIKENKLEGSDGCTHTGGSSIGS